jgi:hypothetical protein
MAFGEKEMSTEYHHGALMKDAFTEVPNRPSTVWHDGTVSEFGEFGIRGIPEERIRSGVGSDSTVTDFAYAMGLTFDEKGKLQKDDRDGFLEGGSLSPDDYNAEHPLGVVAHPEHMKRVLRVAKAFGFMHILPIATNGEYGLAERTDGPLREFVLRAAITWGTNNPETMRKREVRIANALDLVRRGVGLLSLSRTTEQPSN